MKGVTIKTVKRKTTISRTTVRKLVNDYFKNLENAEMVLKPAQSSKMIKTAKG